MIARLCSVIGLVAVFLSLSAGTGLAVPAVTATKDDGIAPGVRKLVGDAINYTITIGNGAAATDATGVTLTDPTPANTTLVAGSVHASPLAFADSYSAVGNTKLYVGTTAPVGEPAVVLAAGQGLFANDVTITDTTVFVSNTAPAHGAVTVNSNGTFTYTPTVGYSGPDSFTYTVRNSADATLTDTGTVNITVSNPVWYVNNSAGAGNGSSASPFNSLTGLNAAGGAGDSDGPNDIIYIYKGSAAYTGGLPLESGQRLTSESVALVVGAVTLRAAVPANVPTLSHNASSTVALSSGNTIASFVITNSAGSGISGAAIGTTAISNIAVTVTGGTALNATTSGTLTVTGTNALSSTNGAALNVQNVTIGAGGLTFQSIATSGGTANGINLTNTGSSGGLTVTGTGTAGSGGTLQNITGADAIVLNTVGGLVSLTRMIIQDITAGTDATDALQTHSGVDAIHGRAVSGGLTLNTVTIQRISDNAINGTVDGVPVTTSPTFTTWSGLTLTNCTFTNTNRFNVAGRGDATNESAVIIWGIKGTVSVTGCGFTNTSSGLDFYTDTAGTLDMTVRSNTFTNLYKEIGTNSVGRFGISVVQRGSLISTIRIGDTAGESNATLGNTFSNGGNIVGVRAVADTGATGAMKVSVAKNTFTVTDHSSPGQPPGNTVYNFPQSGVLYRSLGSGNFEGIFAANTMNEVMHADGGLGQLTLIAEKGDSEFIVRNNTFNKPWDLPMEIRADGQAGGQNSCRVQITGNTHIDGIVGDGTTDLGGQSPYGSSFIQVRNNGRLDLTMQNEATPLGLTDTSSATGLYSLFCQTTSAGDVFNLFLQNIQGPRGYRLSSAAGTTFNLFRNGSGAATPQLVLQANSVLGGAGVDNTNPPAVTTSGTITLSNTAPQLPSIIAPLLFMPAEIGSLDMGAPDSTAEAITWTENVRASRGGEMGDGQSSAVLTQAQLDGVVAAARVRWEASGLSAEQRAALDGLKFEIADLPGWYLGEAAGSTIRVDMDAGGNGWQMEATPASDALFRVAATPSSPGLAAPSLPGVGVLRGEGAAGLGGEGAAATLRSAATRFSALDPRLSTRIDLLTAILHEMGHALGLDDTYAEMDRGNLMYGFLPRGERRLPAPGQAAGAVPHTDGAMHFLSAPISIGTLPPGKTVTVKYSVTITGAVISISNQGTVSGSNFTSVLTDDTTVAGSADPTVTPVQLPPVVTNVGPVNVNEDLVLTFAAAMFNAGYSDPNSDPLTTVRITSLPVNGVLKNGPTTITTVPTDIAIASIGSLTYTPNLNYNGGDSFGWNGSDGTLFAVSGALFNISVIAVNDAPVLAAIEGAALAYTENAPAAAITAAITVADVDSANLAGATVQITGNYSNGQDLLEFTPQAGITGIFAPATGLMTLSGSASLASYQTALRTVTYRNTSENPSTATRTVTFRANDGGALNNLSNTPARNITVAAVNDAPVITGQAALSTAFNTARSIALADLTVTDPDNTYPTGFTLSVQNGTNYTRSGNTITPALNFIGTLSVPAKVNDGAADSNTFNLVVTVNPDPLFAQNATSIAPEPGGGFRVRFIGNPGQTYTIQFTPALIPLNWQPLGTRTADANGDFSIVDTPPPGTPMRFYRWVFP